MNAFTDTEPECARLILHSEYLRVVNQRDYECQQHNRRFAELQKQYQALEPKYKFVQKLCMDTEQKWRINTAIDRIWHGKLHNVYITTSVQSQSSSSVANLCDALPSKKQNTNVVRAISYRNKRKGIRFGNNSEEAKKQ
eukprot:44709_1